MGSEAGPAAERKLASFDGAAFQGGAGATAGTGVATGKCNFRPTSEVLDHSYITAGTVTSANGVYSLASDGSGNPLLAEGSTANIVGQVSVDRWTDEDIVLARFKPKFKLNNYDALADDSATKNYKYYSYDGSSWSVFEGDNSDGVQEMANVCICKPKRGQGSDCNTACDEGDGTNDMIIMEVQDGGSAGVAGTAKTLSLGLRKIIGVASLCGTAGRTGTNGASADKHSDITAAADDIFVWGMFDAHDSFEFTLTENTVVDHTDLTGQAANDLTGFNAIEYTLTMGTHDVDTYDLLFIEEPEFDSIANLYTDHGAGNDGSDVYKIESHTGYVASGGLAVTGADVNLECAVTLSVKSQVASHWHCFRTPSATNNPNQRLPGSLASGASSDQSGNDALDTFDIATDAGSLGTASTINDACTAQLIVNCNDARSTITGTDNRVCDLSHDYGSRTMQAADQQADFYDCYQSSWFTTQHTFYAEHEVFNGNYQAAVVQAVRLANNRRYPKDAKDLDEFTNIYAELFTSVTGNDASGNPDWQCDSNNCASADPYVVLDTAKVTVDYEFVDGVGPFVGETVASDDPTNLNGGAGVAYKAQGALLTDTDTSTLACTKNAGEGNVNSVQAEGCDYNSGEIALAAPPASFPETYVFGVASFDFSSDLDDGNNNGQELVNPGAVTQDSAPASRRLRSTSSNVQKSFFVVATANNILK